MKKILQDFGLLVLLSFTVQSSAIGAEFVTGPLIEDYGKHASVQQSSPVSKQTKLKVVFDVAKQSGKKQLNRSFDSLARFLNMHVTHGIPAENIELALVVHGSAGFDLLNHSSYNKMAEIDNPNHDLLEALMANNVKIYLCGQSAAYMGITPKQVQNGVHMALSAMTAHALLQQQGYTLNPF